MTKSTEPQGQPANVTAKALANGVGFMCAIHGGRYETYCTLCASTASQEAPERIWLDKADIECWYPTPSPGDIEYVRADLAPSAATVWQPLRELFDLFERDSKGRWLFKSLSRDAGKLDAIMNKLAELEQKGKQVVSNG